MKASQPASKQANPWGRGPDVVPWQEGPSLRTKAQEVKAELRPVPTDIRTAQGRTSEVLLGNSVCVSSWAPLGTEKLAQGKWERPKKNLKNLGKIYILQCMSNIFFFYATLSNPPVDLTSREGDAKSSNQSGRLPPLGKGGAERPFQRVPADPDRRRRRRPG